MSKKELSIIVPHKNSFECLLRLLFSIPKDDRVEVIVVDDNSNDESVEKLTNYSFDENIRILFNKEQGGFAGKARNIGLEHATGKWLLFADADDYFSENMLELLESFFAVEEDIIYFAFDSIYDDTKERAYRHERYVKLITDYVEDASKEDALRYYFTSPCGKMIRHSIVKNNFIKFDEVIASNDVMFSIKTASYAKKIAVCLDTLYIITVSSGSLTTSFSKQHFDARFRVALRANNYLRSIKKPAYQMSVLYFIAKSYKFGFKYMFLVFGLLVKNRSNIFIGAGKILNYRKVLNERENKKYLVTK